MPGSIPDRSKSVHPPELERHIDMSELADCIANARGSLGSDSSLPEETRREINQSLEYAEATLRRATAEKSIFDRIKKLLSDN
jgi:hypothetical protein